MLGFYPLHKLFLIREVKRMRELFTAPEAEVVTFAAQDIVTTSTGLPNDEWAE